MSEKWTRATLSDVAEVVIGRQRSPKNAEGDHMIPYLRSANVKDGRLDLADVMKMNFTPQEQELFALKPGDVLVSEGSASRAQVGASAVWRGELPGVVCFQNTLLRFRARPALSDPAFLAAWTSHAHRSGSFARLAGGSSILHIGSQRVSRMPVQWPTLSEQRRIADLVSALDAAVVALNDEAHAAAASAASVRAELMRPTAAWVDTPLEAVAEVFDGPHATPTKTKDGPWYLSISSLTQGRVDLASSAHLSAQDHTTWTRRVAPQRGDTLFSYETRLGEAGYWDIEEPAALGRRMGLLRPRPQHVEAKFLTHLYLSPAFQALIEDRAVRGSTVDRIPIARIGTWRVRLPPLDAQRSVVATLDAADAHVHSLWLEVEALREVRAALLESLLSGAVLIPQSYDSLLEGAG